MLTFVSIYIYKGDPRGFWLPELIRNDLETEFRSIHDMAGFWDFTQNTISEYVFENERMTEEYNFLNLTYLNSFDENTLADNSKGRMHVG